MAQAIRYLIHLSDDRHLGISASPDQLLGVMLKVIIVLQAVVGDVLYGFGAGF
jgi:hypothetical protein